MAGDAELISVGIPKVRAIVVIVVLRSQPWFTLRRAAVCECDSIGSVDDRSALRVKGDHLTISAFMRQFVVGYADEEKWSRTRSGLPAGPWTLALTEASIDAEDGHQRIVERQRAVEVADAYEDVRKHAALSNSVFRRLTVNIRTLASV